LGVGAGRGLVGLGEGRGPVGFGDGDGLVRVGEGDGPVLVGLGDGPVRVGDGDGPVRVGDGDGPVLVGLGEGRVLVGLGDGLVGDGLVEGLGGGLGVVQAGTVMTSSSRVTAPLRASARPIIVSPVVTVIDCSAKIFPWNAEFVPSVAELPTCQYTLQACAPLVSKMWLAELVMSVEPTWKTKTASGLPCALRVSAPPTFSDDVAL
jgi:hypothetical protein